jgi:hypothetical protein
MIVAHHKISLLIRAFQILYFADFRRHAFLPHSQMTNNEMNEATSEPKERHQRLK